MKYLSFLYGTLDVTMLERFSRLILDATNNALKDPQVIAHLGRMDKAGSDSCRSALAKFLTEEYEEPVKPENIFISSGATYEIFQLGSDTVLPSTCKVVIEATTFYNSFGILKHDLGREMIPVPLTNEGVDTKALEKIFQKIHSETDGSLPFSCAFYCIPAFQNPTGICYSDDVKREIIRLAKRYRVLVLADEVYILLYYNQTPRPRRMRSIAVEEGCEDLVVSIGSFSKFCAPALRLGWIECSADLVTRLGSSGVVSATGCMGQLPVLLVTNMIERDLLRPHVQWAREHLKKKCDLAVNILSEDLHKGISFQTPKGGMFLWIKLPAGWDSNKLLEFSMDRFQLNFSPGPSFSSSLENRRFLRFSIGPHDGKDLEEGVTRLRNMIKDYHALITAEATC